MRTRWYRMARCARDRVCTVVTIVLFTLKHTMYLYVIAGNLLTTFSGNNLFKLNKFRVAFAKHSHLVDCPKVIFIITMYTLHLYYLLYYSLNQYGQSNAKLIQFPPHNTASIIEYATMCDQIAGLSKYK